MFDPSSRYFTLETVTNIAADGRELRYKRRRFLPQIDSLNIVAQVAVAQGDRLDLITARTLGASEQFWQVCDANSAMNPFDLVSDETVGAVVNIAMPQTPQATR